MQLQPMRNRTVLYFCLFVAFYCKHAQSSGLFEDLPDEKIVVATTRFEFDQFPDAFNPSIIKVPQGFLLTFRYCPDRNENPWLAYVGVALLNDALEQISEPELLNTRQKNSKTPSQVEDARVFSYKGRLFLIYNDNIDLTSPMTWDRRDMFMAELTYVDNQFKLSSPLKLAYEAKYHTAMWQKNWVPFEWNNMLLMTYSINPHEILYPNLMNGSCYHCYDTWMDIDWKWGKLRGSTPPLLVDGEYLAFFHSGAVTSSRASWGWELWHYFMGAYTFSAEPPFKITKISPHPIVAEGFYTQSAREKRVIFPGGFAVSGPYIYMAYGKDDYEIWIATIDKDALKKSLVPIEK